MFVNLIHSIMTKLHVRQQCRKMYLRYILILIFTINVLVLLSIYSNHGNPKAQEHDDSLQSETYEDSPRASLIIGKQATVKDNYNLVTAVSSREFKWLLEFIDSVVIERGEFELIIWSLDLRDCEFNYINNLKTPFRIHLHHFPYHFHPLHIRYYHLTAIKPIVLESAAVAFGEAIWIEPDSIKLPSLLDNIMQILSDKGFIAASSSEPLHRQCLTVAIGVNYLRYKTFIEGWAECARNNSCIAETLHKSKERTQLGVDMLFELHRKEKKFPCVVVESQIESSDVDSSSVLTKWKINEMELCKLHKGCVLTGSHKTQECLTPQLGRLRRNKMKYTNRHGYVYIEETFGFHRSAPCHRVWDKVHAILKYLGDCELLFWVDTDAVFVDMDKTLESFIDSYSGKEFLVGWPRTDRMLNAGVLLMLNTPTVRQFFLNITNGKTWTGDWCSRNKFEQAAIRDQLDSGTMNGKFVMERSNALQTLCSFHNKECVVSEKDFIAHFAPPNCPALHSLVKTFLDKNPQCT